MRPYIWIISLMIISFFGCRENAREISSADFYFDVPQPDGKRELGAIPRKYRGEYIEESDMNRKLIINDKYIISVKSGSAIIPKDALKDSLNEDFSYRNGKIYSGLGVYDVTEKNDSLYLSVTFSDTLFALSASNKLKRLNGELILNRRDSLFWKINILNLRKDTLHWWWNLNSKEDYIALKSVVKNVTINADTTVVNLQPTKKEFKKILNLTETGWIIKYVRIK